VTVVAALVVASAVLSVAGNVLIWRETWRREARPVAASWLEWAGLMGVGAAAAWQAGQVPAAVYGAVCAIGCAGVVPITLIRIPAADRDPPVRVGQARLDVLLLPFALAGLMLLVTPLTSVGHGWVGTLAPAVAAAVATDALAYLPTAGHAWARPWNEPWNVYGLYGVGAACSLAAVALQGQMLDLTASAYPLYLVAADLGVAFMIVYRRMAVAPPADPWGLPWSRLQVSDGPDGRLALVTVTPPDGPAQVIAGFRPHPAAGEDGFRAWPGGSPWPPEPEWPEASRRAAVTDAVGLLAAEVHH
jgi:hypothetical protein